MILSFDSYALGDENLYGALDKMGKKSTCIGCDDDSGEVTVHVPVPPHGACDISSCLVVFSSRADPGSSSLPSSSLCFSPPSPAVVTLQKDNGDVSKYRAQSRYHSRLPCVKCNAFETRGERRRGCSRKGVYSAPKHSSRCWVTRHWEARPEERSNTRVRVGFFDETRETRPAGTVRITTHVIDAGSF